MSDIVVKLVVLAIIIFVINLPFGFLRASVKKFSFKRFLYITCLFQLLFFLRIYSDIGFAYYTYPILLGAFFMGQLVGCRYAISSGSK